MKLYELKDFIKQAEKRGMDDNAEVMLRIVVAKPYEDVELCEPVLDADYAHHSRQELILNA